MTTTSFSNSHWESTWPKKIRHSINTGTGNPIHMTRSNPFPIQIFSLFFLAALFVINPTRMQAAPVPALQDSTRVSDLLLVDTVKLQIFGPTSDVSFYENGLIFLSNTKYHQRMIADHISFGVIRTYFVPLDYLSLESSRPLFPNDDFPYSPAGMSFSRDYRTVYFTRPEEISGQRTVEKIFEMRIIDGKASEQQQLQFTTDASRYLHPAISQDDSIMVFSSDRNPTSGGLDLFVTRKTPAGWSDPVNLGRGINTSGHEWYPFLDHRKNLYFSSSGHKGKGGYDVYVCFFDGSGWSEPHNLTEVVNTPGDEFGFSIRPGNKLAIFTRIMNSASKGVVLTLKLNDKAIPAGNSENSDYRDLSLLIHDMTGSGYTAGKYETVPESSGQRAFNLASMPLINSGSSKESPPIPEGSGPATEAVIDSTGNRLSTEGPAVLTQEAEMQSKEPEAPVAPDPNRINFRVQILSSTKPNSQPRVTVDGKEYPTFEYFYKGAYRITVGEFATVREANAFRARCKSSGFNQSFVAAFRGEVRETDPSVFRNH
nr:putative outer membrane-related protein [uncultured bacterium]